MKTINKLLLLSILFLIMFSFITSAKIGNMEKVEKGWIVEHSTDYDYFVYFDNVGVKNSQICLLHQTATNMGQIAGDKALINKEGNQISILHPQMKRIDGTNYFGYCYTNIDKDYLKFGEHSTIVTYQDENKLVYDCGDGKQMNVTLYKNVSDVWETSGSIWVYNYEDSCKFGANDSENSGIEVYKYELVLTLPYILDIEENETHIYDWDNRIINTIHFDDICLNSSFGCEYNQINDYNLEVLFDSNSFIDPFIEVSPIASNSISLTSLGENIIVLGRTFNGNANISMYYTNGTLITNKNIDSGLGLNGRIEVEARNENSFVAYWFNDIDNYGYYEFFNQLGQNLTGKIQHKLIGGEAPDFSLMFRDSLGIEDLMYIGLVNDNTNEFEMNIINLTNGTSISYQLDDDARPENVLYNLVSCDFANSTLIACSYYDDESDDGTLILWDIISKTIKMTIDLDDNIGNDGQVTNAVSDSAIATLFLDDSEGVMKLSLRDFNGINLTSLLTIDPVSDNPSRVSISSVYSTIYSQYLFVPVWWDSTNGMIEANVYFKNGTRLYNYTLSSFPNPSYPLFDTFGYNPYLDNGLNAGTYAFSFVNSTGQTLLNIYYLNGTESRIITLDYFPPNYTNLSPENNTYTNETAINFSLNATDNVELDNGTLYIYNETGALINVSEQDLSGNQSIFSKVYNFVVDGIYTWFVRIYDTAGNFVDTIIRTITIDSSAPIINYVNPTLLNGTIIPNNNIEVNVTADDLNLSYIKIDFYKEGILISSINNSYSPFYHNFIGLEDKTNYQFNASACDVNNECSILELRQINVDSEITSNISFNVELSQYPYLDLNVSYTFDGRLLLSSIPISDSNVSLYIEKGNENWTYQMIYNPSTQTYQKNLAFTEEGTYGFIATSNHSIYGLNIISGAIIVAEPFYITLRIYEVKDTDADPYENDFGYILAEFTSNSIYGYDETLENFISPLLFSQTFNKNVFHARYDDGEATLKLWEDTNYALRFVDGELEFNTSYSPPLVLDSYGTNFFLGEFSFNGTDEDLNIYAKQREIHQYRWLFNILLIIGLIVALIGGIFIFFVIPEHPLISLTFAVGFSITLIIIRVVFFIWLSW